MKTKLLSPLNTTKHYAMAIQLGELTFIFFLLKGFFWAGVSGWFIYLGSGAS